MPFLQSRNCDLPSLAIFSGFYSAGNFSCKRNEFHFTKCRSTFLSIKYLLNYIYKIRENRCNPFNPCSIFTRQGKELLCRSLFRIFLQILLKELTDAVVSFFKYLFVWQEHNSKMLCSGFLPEAASRHYNHTCFFY